MDRKGGGPMKWSQFYGTTAEKFFYHPTDRNSSYHTVTVLSPQPPQNDNQTGPGIPSRQGLPVHQRPPQFDYIYRANEGGSAKAESEAAGLRGKVEALTARRRELELEQVALWVEIAFRAAAHFELNRKPVFRFELVLPAGALGWPINTATEIEREPGIAEPEYTDFVPPASWRYHVPCVWRGSKRRLMFAGMACRPVLRT